MERLETNNKNYKESFLFRQPLIFERLLSIELIVLVTNHHQNQIKNEKTTTGKPGDDFKFIMNYTPSPKFPSISHEPYT